MNRLHRATKGGFPPIRSSERMGRRLPLGDTFQYVFYRDVILIIRRWIHVVKIQLVSHDGKGEV